MPEGNKIWVSGDGVESNRPATNSPGIEVDSNRFDCLVEKSGLDVDPRSLIEQGESRHVGVERRGSARRSGHRGRIDVSKPAAVFPDCLLVIRLQMR